MKVLQVVHGLPPRQMGGTQILTYNLSKELSKRHEVHVFYRAYKKGRNEYYVASFNRGEIETHELIVKETLWDAVSRLLRFELPNLYYKINKVDKKFEELLNEINPDIVHFQHLMGFSVSLPLIAKHYTHAVLNLNDYWLVCPTTHFLRSDGKICNDFSYKDCARCLYRQALKAVFGKSVDYNFLSNVIIKVLGSIYEASSENKIANRALSVNHVIKSVDKIISPSKSVVNEFVKNHFVSNQDLRESKVIVLHHGIDLYNLMDVRKRPVDRVRFGFVGFISERKGLHILIEAFKRLGNGNVELIIYGEIKPANKYHKYLIEKSNNNKNIKFMGSFDDVKEPYSNIDILVVPSITYEGYGLVVQEAFATKTPVIASDIGALNEFVKHMKNGMLFRVGDSDDLTEKMQMIIENPNLLQQLTKDISSAKSVESYASEFERVYQEVINKASEDLLKVRTLDEYHFLKLMKDLPVSEALWRSVELDALSNMLNGSRIKSPILDLGCGNGLIGDILFKKIDVGMDINSQTITFAQRFNSYKNLIIADARELPFPDGTFNTIFSNCVLEHIPNVDLVFKEAGRVLKNGGKFVFTIPSLGFSDFLLFSSKRYTEMRNQQLQHFSLFSLTDWESICNNFKFEIVKSKFYMSPAMMKIWDCLDIGFHLPIFRWVWACIMRLFKPLMSPILYNTVQKNLDCKTGGGLAIVAVKKEAKEHGKSITI
ncbi:MAG: glycosyltransferase [Flavobacteriaceae bacterium]|nr:glycosyltransferase [Flavobacteriaceae bacterium]